MGTPFCFLSSGHNIMITFHSNVRECGAQNSNKSNHISPSVNLLVLHTLCSSFTKCGRSFSVRVITSSSEEKLALIQCRLKTVKQCWKRISVESYIDQCVKNLASMDYEVAESGKTQASRPRWHVVSQVEYSSYWLGHAISWLGHVISWLGHVISWLEHVISRLEHVISWLGHAISWLGHVISRLGMLSHDWDTLSHDWDTLSHDWDMLSHDLDMLSHDWNMLSHDWGTLSHDWDTSFHDWSTSVLWLEHVITWLAHVSSWLGHIIYWLGTLSPGWHTLCLLTVWNCSLVSFISRQSS